jgi:hypothetical protein
MTSSLNAQFSDQRSICTFLAIKGLSAQAIASGLVTVLGSNEIAYSTMTMHLRHLQSPLVPCDPSKRAANTVIDNAILDAL